MVALSWSRRLLNVSDLKVHLHKDYNRVEKLLIVLASFGDAPVSVAVIRERAQAAGFRIPSKWNVSLILGRSDGQAIRTTDGWELSESGRGHIQELGILQTSAAKKMAVALRKELESVADEDTRAFLDEAISCAESSYYRSAIVMSWLAAVHVLQRHVIASHLKAFNDEAARVDSKWKVARTQDDLGRMKEKDFLDRLASISVIGKNVKSALQECLDRRNACGHPNSYKLSENTVAHHLETLLLNVFQKFP